MGAVGGDGGFRRVHPGRFAAALRAVLPSRLRPYSLPFSLMHPCGLSGS